MTSKMFNRSHPVNFNTTPSPDTMYHFSCSPGEAGKFDFYRVHLANNASDSIYSDSLDAPTLSSSTTTDTTKHWSLFSNSVSSNQSKSSTLTSSVSSSSIPLSKTQIMPSNESSVLSNTNGTQSEPVSNIGSSSSLTDIVRNAIHIGHTNSSSNQKRRPIVGTTLSTKDLNHLSPQSM